MTKEEALEKLQEYKGFEGRNVLYKGNVFEIRKVIAAPSYLPEFTANYQDYVDKSEYTVRLGLSDDYDIYFYKDPYASMAFFILLDDFLANVKID